MVCFMSTISSSPSKNQIKPKEDFRAIDSPKKRTNKRICLFCFFTPHSLKKIKFVRSFFGRICLWFYLTFTHHGVRLAYKILTLETTIFGLTMIVKSGLKRFILKLNEPLWIKRYQLICQANSAFLGHFFCAEQQQL